MNELEKITKQDIVDFANEYYEDNYVVVYKRTGEDKSTLKVSKPNITPVYLNREDQSPFLVDLLDEEVKDIEPVFLDFSKDIKKSNIGEVDLIYRQNTENQRFKLNYIFEMGTNHDRRLGLAINYLRFLGTDSMSSSEVQQEFYKHQWPCYHSDNNLNIVPYYLQSHYDYDNGHN